ncbi:phosphate signaling complex protein PhoU [uncultured Selenomonas sp.]|uniref:phosphate signaling complex protein PhoU n=1 Tax=uncultured Selenomonas sp. TaxID=159275 RepID=UPI0025E88B3C|nr:phosphate signaling complex protein PhoU [uncultured Selenomonas sp.]
MQEIQKTRQEYIQALADVQGKVYQMGLRAEAAVQLALQSLLENDHELADRVMREDDDIDDMIIDIENDCILLIAKQQPMAHDLRVIATGFKISTDIERIGDHAFDIARTAKSDGQLLDREHAALVKELGDCAIDRDANVRLADEVRHMDKRMDDIFQRTFYALSHFVSESGTRPEEATKLLFIARFLERIGDHAVNIAEWVVYLETAERIRTRKARYEK